jgi:hypothetical protein
LILTNGASSSQEGQLLQVATSGTANLGLCYVEGSTGFDISVSSGRLSISQSSHIGKILLKDSGALSLSYVTVEAIQLQDTTTSCNIGANNTFGTVYGADGGTSTGGSVNISQNVVITFKDANGKIQPGGTVQVTAGTASVKLADGTTHHFSGTGTYIDSKMTNNRYTDLTQID